MNDGPSSGSIERAEENKSTNINSGGSSGVSSGTLRSEWSLLISGFIENPKDSEKTLKTVLKEVDPEALKGVIKTLSADRKIINNKIEKIKSKLDHLLSVIDNLNLVGSETAEINSEIDSLTADGQKLSSQLLEIDEKIKNARMIMGQLQPQLDSPV